MLCHNSILLQIQCFITSSHFTCRMTEQLQISLVHTPTPSRKACSDCAPCWIVIRRVLWEQTQMEEHREKSARREGGGGRQGKREKRRREGKYVGGWMGVGGGRGGHETVQARCQDRTKNYLQAERRFMTHAITLARGGSLPLQFCWRWQWWERRR